MLKKALANKEFTLPGHFEFNRSSTKLDIITEGPRIFRSGYQIKVMASKGSGDISETSRTEIDVLTNSLLAYYYEHRMTSHAKETNSNTNESVLFDYIASLVSAHAPAESEANENVYPTGASSHVQQLKRKGRPALTIEKHAKRFRRSRM